MLLVNELEDFLGGNVPVTDHGVSHLAHNIVFPRYLELGGELSRAIGGLEKM